MATKIQVVLPLKISNGERGSDLERVRAGLVPSLRRYCDPTFIERLSIVVPEADLELARSFVRTFQLPSEVLPEAALLPHLPHDIPRRGWYLQQLVKLAYSKICTTPFYLTLDSDVFLLNHLGPEVFRDGRAPAHYEPVSAHQGWWMRSAEIAEETQPALIHNDDKAFGVTPAFLAAEITRELIERLDYLGRLRENSDWVDYLCHRTTDNELDSWTGFSLYWTHLLHNVQDVEKLYYERRLYSSSHSPQGILRAGRNRDDDAEIFGVLQSSHVNVVDFSQTIRTLLSSRDLQPESQEKQELWHRAGTTGHGVQALRFDKNATASATKTYSQNNEDGILSYMISRLPEVRRYFVEFGVGPPWRTPLEASGLEANCRLLREQGWDGLFMDANDYPPEYEVRNEFVTALNINQLLNKYRVPPDLDIISIDVDGQDFWIWMNLLFTPKIVVIEQNPTLERNQSVVIPFDTQYRWDGTTWFGASLKSLDKLGTSKGYVLVYTTSANAIFVRRDLIANPEDFVYDELYSKHELHVRDWLNRTWITI